MWMNKSEKKCFCKNKFWKQEMKVQKWNCSYKSQVKSMINCTNRLKNFWERAKMKPKLKSYLQFLSNLNKKEIKKPKKLLIKQRNGLFRNLIWCS